MARSMERRAVVATPPAPCSASIHKASSPYCTCLARLPDAWEPGAGLVVLNGTLYGTSEAGGSANEGTVFSITSSGTEKVIYSFKGGTMPEQPMTPLVSVNGKLFGTANGGGGQSGGGGTIFVVTPSGSEKVLYRFVGGNTDGLYPSSGLTNFHGKLYGVTVGGGKSGAGTVFVVSQTGSEKMLHAFGGVGRRAPHTADSRWSGTRYMGRRERGWDGIRHGVQNDVQIFADHPHVQLRWARDGTAHRAHERRWRSLRCNAGRRQIQPAIAFKMTTWGTKRFCTRLALQTAYFRKVPCCTRVAPFTA